MYKFLCVHMGVFGVKKNFFIEVQLIYHVVLTSVVQQSNLIHTHTHTHILFHIFSIMVYLRILNTAPCAIQ